MKTKILRIFYDLRHQPVVTWVTLVATAMAIFLIMVVMMMQRVSLVPFTPESCRDRLMVGAFIHLTAIKGNNDSSGGMSFSTAKTLYGNLDGVEHTSYMELSQSPHDLTGTTGEMFSASGRRVDAEFFEIFDHKLLEGRYFTKEEADAVLPVAVVSESTARRLFGGDNAIGAGFSIDHKPYTVVGVIADNTPLATIGYGEVFMPTGPEDPMMHWNSDNDSFGPVSVSLLVKDGVDLESVRDQVKARYAEMDTRLEELNWKTVYHGGPFDQAAIATGVNGSNVTPDTESADKERLIIYAILLIVPAINLSSMLHSRLRRRVSETGLRRAFGCTRSRLIADIISENFILTLLGGIAGLALGIIFASTSTSLYETMENFGLGARPPLSALLDWHIMLFAVGACFVLNIISACVPAWQASRMSPIEAINSK